MRVTCAMLLSFCLVLVGCAGAPRKGMPSGTYREASGTGDAIVVDGDELIVHLPSLQGAPVAPDGRSYSYSKYPDGLLRLWGSSNDSHFLRLATLCQWRWSSPAIECRQEDGVVRRFERNATQTAALPATPQQQVWLAAAQKVLANETLSASASGPLPVYHRTSFPRRRSSLAQLERQAAKDFCGLSREAANGVVRSLHWQNKTAHSIGDVFDHRPEFVVVDRPPAEGDFLGLSDVMFTRDGDTAFVNVDIGGLSGSVVQMKRAQDGWAWSGECAVWTDF